MCTSVMSGCYGWDGAIAIIRPQIAVQKMSEKYSSNRFTLPMEALQVPGVETESVVSAPMASAARGVTRVLLLADAPVLRRGLVSMINETAGMQSVGTPGELRRALTLAESARPDAVVVELGSGRAATLNACRDLRRRFPRVA